MNPTLPNGPGRFGPAPRCGKCKLILSTCQCPGSRTRPGAKIARSPQARTPARTEARSPFEALAPQLRTVVTDPGEIVASGEWWVVVRRERGAGPRTFFLAAWSSGKGVLETEVCGGVEAAMKRASEGWGR